MKRRWVSLLLLLLGALFCIRPAAAQEKAYWAEQFDSTVTVEAGGALLVREQITYHFAGEPFTFIFREIPTDHTDGVTIVETRLDGDRLPAGTTAGRVEIEGSDPIRVTWHMAPTVDQSRTVELVYRMEGVVRQGEGADLLRYQILPDDYDFFVESSRHRFTYPGSATLLGTPALTAGQGQVAVEGQEVVVTGTGYEADEPLVVEMRFRPGSIIDAPPAWQARQQAQNALAPWWLALAGAIILAGAGGLIYFQSRYRPAAGKVPSTPIYEPPTDLPPALAGTIAGSGGLKPEWAQALAALFSLADREILAIEEMEKTKWYQSRDFVVTLRRPRPADLLPHEAALLDLLFVTDKERTESVKFSELSRRTASKRWRAFQEAAQAEIKGAGLLDPERQRARRRLNVAGLLLLFLGLGSMLLAVVWGPWALSAAFSLLLVAVATLIYATAFRPLSAEGAHLAARWTQFQDYLKGVSKGQAAATRPDLFEHFLPYATAFGLLGAWAKHFERVENTPLPLWFHAASSSGANHMGAFVAMSAAASSSGGSAAGAAGAGAAGGGAAGAG